MVAASRPGNSSSAQLMLSAKKAFFALIVITEDSSAFAGTYRILQSQKQGIVEVLYSKQ